MWPYNTKEDAKHPEHYECRVCQKIVHAPDMVDVSQSYWIGFSGSCLPARYVCKTCIAGSMYERRALDHKPKKRGKK